jgi:hypothetical protein
MASRYTSSKRRCHNAATVFSLVLNLTGNRQPARCIWL